MADIPSFPTYETGTVSIENGSFVVSGFDTRWQRVHVRMGDRMIIDPDAGTPEVTIRSVEERTSLMLMQRWTHGTKTNVPYIIIKGSIDRTVGTRSWEDIDLVIQSMGEKGYIYNVPASDVGPDESDGYDGQYAAQESTGKRWRKTDGEWEYLGIANAVFSRYDFLYDDPGQPGSGEEVYSWIAPSTVTLRAGLVESRAKAKVAAAANSVFSLRRNGVQFATMSFAPGATNAAFTLAADATFVAGDMFTIIAPNPRDASLKGITATIVAYR